MIYVCDAIMGTGKSQSAIAYMNAHPDRKFIYLSPYLDEAARIWKECPELHFVEPQKLPEFRMSKSLHALYLIEHGRNVASTHQAFSYYTADTLQAVRENGYTLIIDEDMVVLEDFNFDVGDLKTVVDAGHVRREGNLFLAGEVEYTGKQLWHMLRLLKSRTLEIIKERKTETDLVYWAIPADLMLAFRDVFILTYMYPGSDLDHFMQMSGIPVCNIGIRRTEDGGYEFAEDGDYVPEYVSSLASKIHICDHRKLNAIGARRCSLSKSWFQTNKDGVEKMRKNINNYFRNLMDDFSSDERMWTSFKGGHGRLRGKGYSKGFVSLNTKATNEFRHKRVLAYPVNLYFNVSQKLYYNAHGISVSEDRYALSNMIQWIWRSAIRDGEEIWVYVPSERMRSLLVNWIDAVSNGRSPLPEDTEEGEAA